MVAGIILLVSFMLFISQLVIQGSTGDWPSITIASELGLPGDRAYADWTVFDTPLRFVMNEVQLWIILMIAAGLVYWVFDFTDETLARLLRSHRRNASPGHQARA